MFTYFSVLLFFAIGWFTFFDFTFFVFTFFGGDDLRGARLYSYGDETCYVLIGDHLTEALYGTPRISKAPPVAWL